MLLPTRSNLATSLPLDINFHVDRLTFRKSLPNVAVIKFQILESLYDKTQCTLKKKVLNSRSNLNFKVNEKFELF